jgi:AcrR family transcriptional regulator
MAPNAVLYYFGGLAEIEAAAVQASSDRFLRSLADAVESGAGPTARLAAALQAGISGGLEDDASRILYEYWSHSLRNPELRRIQEEFIGAQQSSYEGIIVEGMAAGEFHPVLEPADIARIIVAQEDGLVMEDVLSGATSSRYVFDLNARLAAVLLAWITQRWWSPPERKRTEGDDGGRSRRRPFHTSHQDGTVPI